MAERVAPAAARARAPLPPYGGLDALLCGLAAGTLEAAPRFGLARGVTVLIYHRVLAAPDPILRRLPTAERFEWQVALLARHFRPMALADALAALDRGRLPPRAICVTFDDGYADNEAVALPILRRHGVPATFFITTGFLEGGRMWNDTVVEALRRYPGDALDLTGRGLGRHPLGTIEERRAAAGQVREALKYLPPARRDEEVAHLESLVPDLPRDLMMTHAQVGGLHAAGMEIGAHTVTHPILSGLAPERAREEIGAGREALEAIIRARVRYFAYPNGKPGQDYTPEHVALVREAGFEAALATTWGPITRRSDRFQLPRFTPWGRTAGRYVITLARNFLRRG